MAGDSAYASLYRNYIAEVSTEQKLVDTFLAAIMFTGIIQFAYACMVGTFPFNSFLAGFISCVGLFVLLVGLRMHINPANGSKISRERALADFVLCALVMFFVVFNFMG